METRRSDRRSLPVPALAALVLVCFCILRVEGADELSGGGGGAGGGPPTRRRRAASVTVPITILKSAVSEGAVCMDGTPPAYNFDPGSGPGSRSWILNLEGGAWCNSAQACRLSKGSGRGSSDHMEKDIPFTGIMSSSRAVNPGHPIYPP